MEVVVSSVAALRLVLVPLAVLGLLLVGGTLGYRLVVCGFGRMGRLVCEEYSAAGLPFVVIDRDSRVLQDFSMEHGIPLSGDANDDEVLKQAGVERARAVVSAAASDADNLYIVMSARFITERLVIIALGQRQQLDRLEAMAGARR